MPYGVKPLLAASALLVPSLIAIVTPASAADRSFAFGSFDRVRVDGPFRVIVTVGASPGGSASGEPRAIDNLDVRVDGTTLTVRAGSNGWGEQGGGASAPVIRVATPALRSVVAIGSGQVRVDGTWRGQRLDLSLTGSGSLAAPGIDADQINATVLGSGTMTLGGRAARVRLTTSGTASVAAAALVANDLIVRLDGNGTIDAQARYTAAVTSTGLGAATIYGKPACTVHADAGGPVSCGKQDAPAG